MANVAKLLNIDVAYHGFTRNPLDHPCEVGCFSVDAERVIHFNRSQMKYYIPRIGRNLSLDLNVGYEDVVRVEDNERGKSVKQLMKWIEYTSFNHLISNEVDFVASRGTIQRLLQTPYPSLYPEPWIICASRLDDIIYIKKIKTDDKLQEEMNLTDRQKRMASWGYRFEQYVTADKEGGVPDTSSNTHETEQFCVVVINRIGRHKILIRAETDGMDPRGAARPGSGETSCYVEMKTTRNVQNFQKTRQFQKFKSLQWWAQSVVVGIEKNICGMRDDNGIVRAIEEFRTSDLPHLCRGNWRPDVCINFCNNFLEYLQERVAENDHRIVHKFEYSGGSRVSVSKLLNPEERYQVIPEWYVASYRKERATYR